MKSGNGLAEYSNKSIKFVRLMKQNLHSWLEINIENTCMPHIKNSKILLEGLRIGEQLQKLKGVGRMSDECESVHQMVNELKRHYFPFEKSEIPLNGIYILFQKGENGHQQERIVRIGTHKAEDRLPLRLRDHFSKENKDSSIFRKNIGRALLHQKNDPFLKYWELKTREAKEKHASLFDYDYQKEIEGLVSQYIKDNFWLSTFKVESKAEERLKIESKLISTISQCDKCAPSDSWLGHSSPKEKIKDSGLWQEQKLYKTPFDAGGIERLSKLIGIN